MFFGPGAPEPVDLERHHVNFDQNPYMSPELEGVRLRAWKAIEESTDDDERQQAQSDYDHIWLGHTRTINKAAVFAGKCIQKDFPDDLWKRAKAVRQGLDYGFVVSPSVLTRSFILDAPEYSGVQGECLFVQYEAYKHGVEISDYGNFLADVPDSDKWPIYADSARQEITSHIVQHFAYNVVSG